MTRPEAPISGIRSAAYRIPTDGPEADGTLRWDATTLIVCDVDAGGETGFGYGYADVPTALFVADVLAPLIAGRDGLDTGRLWRAMVDGARNHGLPGVAAMAISACDAALHDLRGKLLGSPLADLLGRRQDSAAVYGSGGFTNYDERQFEAQLGGWAGQGLPAVKIKIGNGVARDRERVIRARRAIGPEVALMVDANGAYAPAEALAVAHAIAPEDVTWFEEPVSSDDLDGLRHVREGAPPGMAVAAGEYGYHAPYFLRMLEAGAVDALQADASRCCGITGFVQVDALAWAHCRPLSSHTAPALHLHAAMCCQRLCHMEWFHDHVRIEAMLLDGAPMPRQGRVAPDLSRPGLGLALKRTDAERFRIWPEGPS